MVRILGLDPSLSSTGWGIIEVENNRMRYVADGFIPTDTKLPLPERLAMILHTLENVIELYKPDEAAIEQVFLNSNPTSTIKLGMARGVVIMTPALYNIPVTEYEPNKIKKAVVGVGKAEKRPNTEGRSYAQLTPDEKDAISHRGVALAKLEKELPEFLK